MLSGQQLLISCGTDDRATEGCTRLESGNVKTACCQMRVAFRLSSGSSTPMWKHRFISNSGVTAIVRAEPSALTDAALAGN